MKSKWINIIGFLSIFRILIGIALFLDCIYSWDSITILEKSNFLDVRDEAQIYGINYFSILRENAQLVRLVYVSTILLFIFGIGRILSTILLFVAMFFYHILSSNSLIGGDQIIRQVLLFFIFIDGFRFASFTKWYSPYETKFFQTLQPLVLTSILLHLAYIYITTGVFKLMTPSWQQGLGIIHGLGLFPFTICPFLVDLLKENILLAKFFSYSVLAFQFVIPISFFIKKIRIYCLFLAIVMHVFMALLFNLFLFQFIMIMHLGFVFFAEDIFQQFKHTITNKKHTNG